jgi:dolichol-phosphate mannosyltransferase/undecaprenyl-phosphate 4-deoxy-4-formamido-L-arabinose transferase
LPALLEQLTAVLREMKRSYEVILVDDGSPDNTWQVVRDTIRGYPCVSAIQLMRNRGQAFATLCGLSHARGRIVVTMDDDLQHPPREMPKLIAELESNRDLDCVFGCFAEKRHAAYRNFGSEFVGWVMRRSFHLPRDFRSSTFRVMRRELVDAVLGHRTANPALAVLIFSSTSRMKSILVEHAPRYAGKSNYTLAKQIRLAFDGLCNVTTFPLQAISVTGMAVSGLSLVLIVKFIWDYLRGTTGVAGWTSTIVLLCFFAGLILLALGIFGEYMVRILREVRGAPPYVERERIGIAKSEDKR